MNSHTQSRRSVLISGASSGIGRAAAEELAASGWEVFAGVRRLSDAPVSSAKLSGSITAVQLDVSDDRSVLEAQQTIRDHLSGRSLTALVNNAGIGFLAPMKTVPIDDLRAVWDVNVAGTVRLSQTFLSMMSAGSRLIMIGSVGDRLTMPFGGALTSSKWALASIAEAFRLELTGDGVAVSLIEPGSIHSDAVEKVERAAAATAATVSLTDPQLAERFLRAAGVAIANEQHGSSPTVVAHAIGRVLDHRRPPRRVLVGRHARLLATLAAVLPDWAFDRARLRLFDQPPAARLHSAR
jgi:NAD(P)-dependent dehydrogenase (short-subunit alcohol dehydrogenase family)